MAFLRLLVDPDDDLALARVANVPPRGLSAATIQAARAGAAEAGTSLWRELLGMRDRGRLSAAAAGGLVALERLVALGRAGGEAAAGESRGAAVLRRLLDEVGYRRHLDKEYADDLAEAETRWGCCEEVAAALDEHERARRGTADLGGVIRGFLDDFVLQVEEQEDRFKDDKPQGKALRLMTLHAAKGLEFDCVWMVGLEEGILPHHRSLGDGLQAIDEERRLCYVGVTRARRRLMLSLCLTRTKWGKSKPCRPSRFLYEMTGQAEKFQEREAEAKEPDKPPRGRRRR